jgi:hypothetical protein
MDIGNAGALTASVVGLISDFMAHRVSDRAATFDEFQAWLAERRHEEWVGLLKTNQKLALGLKAIFHESNEKILLKLDALDTALATFASRIGGFADVAAAVRPTTILSAQAMSILRRMKDGETSKLLQHERGFEGGMDLIGMDGSAGTIAPEEQQFIEDDLSILAALGLLRVSQNGRGQNLFHYTRAADTLLAASG